MSWIGLLVIATATIAGAEAVPAPGDRPPATAEKPRGPTAEEIARWVSELGSDRFDVREAATKHLASAGAGAVGPLAEAAEGGELEVTCRAIRAIGAIGRTTDADGFEAVLGTLERLAESKNPSVVRRALLAIEGLAEARKRYALARIVELGGKIQRPSPPAAIAGIEDDLGTATQLIIGRNWKGGDAGLIHLRRVEGLAALYITKDGAARVSEKALAELQRDLPHLRIQPRGNAMLGVSCSSDEDVCEVVKVERGTAADRCGLRTGDFIVRYDGEEIKGFDRLIEITRNHEPGDKIAIEVLRSGDVVRLEAELGEW